MRKQTFHPCDNEMRSEERVPDFPVFAENRAVLCFGARVRVL